MAFERTKDIFGYDDRSRRFPNQNDRDLEDVSDPHTIQDDSRRTFREYLYRYRWHVLGVFSLGLAIVGILIVYASRFVPELLGNIWIQRSLVLISIFGAGFVMGNRSTKGSLEQRDELVLYGPNGITRYLGELKTASTGNFPVFEAIKGYSLMGLRSHKYTIGDLDPELARQANRAHRNLDDPVRIRLHPGMTEITKTDTGRVAGQLSAGISLDPFGTESNAVATLPKMADESHLQNLTEKLNELEDKLESQKDLADVYRRQRNKAVKEAKQDTEDTLESYVDFYRKIGEIQSRRRVREGEDTLGAEPVSDVESEVSQDE